MTVPGLAVVGGHAQDGEHECRRRTRREEIGEAGGGEAVHDTTDGMLRMSCLV